MRVDGAKDPLIGTVLGDGMYRIDRFLAEGGMSVVYQGTHLRLGKSVAVKLLTSRLAANPEALTRFQREATVTNGLGHPHIVQMLDFATTEKGEPFLVMELLDGEDLEHRLRRVGRLPLATVVQIVKQVTSALVAMHAKGVVHRDLKPSNIYLLQAAGETDFVKVLDFGVSKIRTANTRLTRTASVIGTPNYMSPEQARGRSEEIDERTDQWALACIAWECLAGQAPFGGEEVPAILFQIVHEQPPSLVSAGVPARIEEVLLRALAKNKHERFANVNELADALAGAIAGTVQVAPVPTALAPLSIRRRPTTFTQTAGELRAEAEPHPSRRRVMVTLAVTAAVVVALGLSLVLRWRSSQKTVMASPTPVASQTAITTSMPPPSVQGPIRLDDSAGDSRPTKDETAWVPPASKPSPKSAVRPAKKEPPRKKPDDGDQERWRVE